MDSYSVFLARVSNFLVSELGFRFQAIFYCFIHSTSSTFYSKLSFLFIPHKSFLKHGQLLDFFSTYFKRPGLGFQNYDFDFKHFFTALYTPFLRHSILSVCLIIPHKSFEKHGQFPDFCSTCFKRPGLGFPN